MWSFLYGLGIGATLAIAGWATYKYAPRFGPNPVFGVRTGYSMVNKQIWDQSQRAGGLMLAMAGGAIALFAGLLAAAGLWDEEARVLAVTGVMTAVLVGGIVWLVLYTRRLAKGVAPASARPLRVSVMWAVPAGVLAAATAAFIIATAGQLPEAVATHFGTGGEANDWMSRSVHVTFGLAIVLGMFALDAGILYLVSHAPLPGADEWSISGETIMQVFAVVMIGVQVLLMVVFFDIFWFNTRGEHFASMTWMVVITLFASVIALPAGVLYVVVKGRRA